VRRSNGMRGWGCAQPAFSAARTGPSPPARAWRPGWPARRTGWTGFTAHLAAAYSPARACQLITALGRLLDEDGHPAHPQALIERARWPGRSMGPLARGLETFFTGHGLAIPTDQVGRRAPAAPHQRRSRAAAPGRGRVRRLDARRPRARPPGRHQAQNRPHHRDGPGNHTRPGAVPRRRARQAGLGTGRRARHRGLPRRPAWRAKAGG